MEDIASISHDGKSKERKAQEKKKLHGKKSGIPLTSQEKLANCEDGSVISFNPLGDGNCQFSALCFWLRSIGIERSPETLQE